MVSFQPDKRVVYEFFLTASSGLNLLETDGEHRTITCVESKV